MPVPSNKADRKNSSSGRERSLSDKALPPIEARDRVMSHQGEIERIAPGSEAPLSRKRSARLTAITADRVPEAGDVFRPASLAAFTETLTAAAWRTVPSTYVVCEQDRAIPLPAQEQMSARATNIRRLPITDSPFLSIPGEVARLIADVAVDQVCFDWYLT
jgi:hypothetical protein